MTVPSDIAGLSERLRDAHPNSMQYINGSNILLDAATALDSLSARVKELEAERMKQIDYSVDLQRIIEGLCHERAIREPQTSARYHYDLAVKYQANAESRALRAEQQRDEAYERAAKVADGYCGVNFPPQYQHAEIIAAAIRHLASGPEGGSPLTAASDGEVG